MSDTLYRSVRSRAGISTRVFRDGDYRTPIVRTEQDVRPILEDNKRQANRFEMAHTQNPIRARHIARIPFVVMQQLARDKIIELGRNGYRVLDERAFLRFLSDPEHRWLRTDNGARLA